MNSAPLNDVDQILADWRRKLSAATENLLELSESPVRQRLARPDVAALLQGQTRAQVEAALQAIGELFQGFSLLTGVIERASDLHRAPVWPWQIERRDRELNHLLCEESIEMGWEATPLARRGLLSEPGRARRVSPEELLRAMMREFEAARDTIARVSRAWDELPLELSTLENELSMGTGSASVPASVPGLIAAQAALFSEIQAISQAIESLRAALSSDPVGAYAAWPALRARGEALCQKIEENARQTRALTEEFARARAALSQLTALHVRAEDAFAEARLAVEVIAPADAGTPLSAGELDDLAAWLDTLDATLNAGRFEAARIGLSRWHESAARALEHERLALETNLALLRRRDELRGRLNALGAKARALAARGVALDPSLETAREQAKSLLRARPIPLEQLARLVSEFEAGLARAK